MFHGAGSRNPECSATFKYICPSVQEAKSPAGYARMGRGRKGTEGLSLPRVVQWEQQCKLQKTICLHQQPEASRLLPHVLWAVLFLALSWRTQLVPTMGATSYNHQHLWGEQIKLCIVFQSFLLYANYCFSVLQMTLFCFFLEPILNRMLTKGILAASMYCRLPHSSGNMERTLAPIALSFSTPMCSLGLPDLQEYIVFSSALQQKIFCPKRKA